MHPGLLHEAAAERAAGEADHMGPRLGAAGICRCLCQDVGDALQAESARVGRVAWQEASHLVEDHRRQALLLCVEPLLVPCQGVLERHQ